MFETEKTLIVVYKDELLMNLLRKMVETHDDSEQIATGTREVSINLISLTEKSWLQHSKIGNIQGKILFLGKIKDTDKLIPVLDIKFDEYGVKFGWAGNRAVVYADPKVLTAREDYDAFLEKLSTLPVPDILKTAKESIVATDTDHETISEVPTKIEALETTENNENKHKKTVFLKRAPKILSLGADAISKAHTQVISKSEEVFRNKSRMKQQMLAFGVVNLYNDGLAKFINM